MKREMIVLLILWIVSVQVAAQPGVGGNNTCETADPFCTGTLYNFPAGVNAGSGQTGPCYNCLTTRPNPAWYYMKVATPGNIIIYMHSEPSEDIDFCCWGPFPTQNSCGQLTCPKVVDCSYSPLAYETCNINNAQTGEYYILIITNFSNQPCNIIFEQTGGTGTTDCTILPPPAANNSPICTGQTLLLTATTINNATYHWWGPSGFSSTQQNPSIPNATQANAGDYFLRVVVNGQPSADTSVTTAFIYQPVANAGNDTSIANGVFTTLHGNCSGGSGSYNYHWEPADKLVNPEIRTPQTVNLFSATVFTLTVTDDSASCQSTDHVTVNISGGALAVNALANPSTICFGSSTQLQAIGSGGAGNYTYQWSGPNGFTSTLPNPVVSPEVTSDYHVTVSDGYNTSGSQVTVNVTPLPMANAGPNDTIPYGTYVFLNGSVTGGSGSYFYNWTPADKLLNPTIQSPRTINLNATTTYSLVATDLITNCISTNNANVTVEVTGGPLNTNPVATPSWICKGHSTQLHPGAGGGNFGFYQYEWTSDPPGFTSAEAEPTVSPVENTTYHLSVNDGYNTVEGSTTVSIYADPYIHLGPPDTTVCVFDTIRLDAGNEGSAFLWNNGSVERSILVNATGIGYETQVWTVQVTNPHGCSKTDSILMIYTFDACTSIDDPSSAGKLILYPNPARSEVTLSLRGIQDFRSIEIIRSDGAVIRTSVIENDITDGKITLDVSTFPAGIYLVRMTGNNFSLTSKLVIE